MEGESRGYLLVVLLALGFRLLRLLRLFLLLFLFGLQRFAVALLKARRWTYFGDEHGAMAHRKHGAFVLRLAVVLVGILALTLFCVCVGAR